MPDRHVSVANAPGPGCGVVLGVDFGTKKIGLAIGQRISGTAVPLGTIDVRHAGEPWKTLSETVVAWEPSLFVVGLSVHPDGHDNPITGDTRRFSEHLKKRYGLPVEMIDETLSTAESRRRYFTATRRSKRAFGDVKDAWAAQVILQAWLDARDV